MSADRLIFVHGWATDSHVWQDVAREFSSVLVDLPGHGGKRGWDEATLAPAAGEVSERMKGLEGEAIGVGWSLGSQALMTASLKQRFRALILVGSTPCFVEKDDFHWGQSKALVKRMILDMKKDPASTVDRFYALNFTAEEAGSPEARAFIERYRYPGPISCEGDIPGCFPTFKYDEVTRALEALYLTDLRKEITAIDIPVLLVHGNNDAVCPVGAAEYMAHRIKGARLEVFEGAGHAPFITERERFITVLKRFLGSIG
ncbi:MAG TPA: hypothetical protein DCR11_03440 [Deltaproteobacteria bacterium]|nr:hypothetical protein [Deltaproteobacteria bacterium]